MSVPENSKATSIGIEAGVDNFTAVLVDEEQQVLESRSATIDSSSSPLVQLSKFAVDSIAGFGNPGRLGIAVPGLIHRETGHVAFSARIPDHSDLDLANTLLAETGLSPLIENDANAAAYAEYQIGAGRGSSSMFYATIGDGVGGAFIFDGKLWHGAAGYAGEFGYVTINSEGLRLEDVASTANIIRRTRNRFNRDSTSSLGKLPEERIGIAEIVRAADEGDEFARLMLERTGMYVGTAVANVINLINVEMVVIGGEITAAQSIVVDAISTRAREYSFSRAFEKTRIVSSVLGHNAAAIGAALIANRN